MTSTLWRVILSRTGSRTSRHLLRCTCRPSAHPRYPRGCRGPSGWLFEHLRDSFLVGDEVFVPFHQVCSHVAAGRVPSQVASILGACHPLAINKGGGGMRPIAIGEVLHHCIVGRAVIWKLRSRLAPYLAPHQLGVAVSGGLETLVRGLQVALDVHSEWGVLQVDVSNAFNLVDRGVVFEELRASSLPELIPFVRSFYGSPSRLLYEGAQGVVTTLASSTGTRQGDPVAGPLFAMALQRALRVTAGAFPHLIVLAYADDISLVGPPAELDAAFVHLRGALREMGLQVRNDKCMAWASGEWPPSVPLSEGIRAAANGFVALGVPIGSPEFVVEHVASSLAPFRLHADLIPHLGQSQVAYLLLTRCFAARPAFLPRCLPPTAPFRAAFDIHDRALLDVLEGVIGGDPFSSLHVRQTHLRTAHGGLGLPSLALQAPLAFVAAWAQVAPVLGSTFAAAGEVLLPAAIAFSPPLSPTFPFQEALRAAHASLPSSVTASLPPFSALTSPGPSRSLAPLAKALHFHLFEGLLASLPSADAKARLLSGAGPAAGAWLHALQLHPATTLSDAHFRSAVRLRLDHPFPHLSGRPLCACGSPFGASASIHLLRYATGGAPIAVHNALRDCVATLTREAGFATFFEPIGLLPLRPGDSTGRRPDLACTDPVGRPRMLVDVTVADPLQRAVLGAVSV